MTQLITDLASQLVAVLLIAAPVIIVSALIVWVLVNLVVGCGAVDIHTSTINTDVCLLYPFTR